MAVLALLIMCMMVLVIGTTDGQIPGSDNTFRKEGSSEASSPPMRRESPSLVVRSRTSTSSEQNIAVRASPAPEVFLRLPVRAEGPPASVLESDGDRVCVFNVNQPLQVRDNNLVGITLLPVRSYYLEMAVYPLSVVDQATNIVELRSDDLQVPSIGFFPNSTVLDVSLSITPEKTLDLVSLQPLQLESWSIVSLDILGDTATLEVRSSVSPEYSFKQEVTLPQQRTLVTSASIYAASPRGPAAADAFINGLKVCLPLLAVAPPPSAPPTEGPSPLPTTVPTLVATPMPSALRTESPTSTPTPAYTIFVPSPTSSPTSLLSIIGLGSGRQNKT